MTTRAVLYARVSGDDRAKTGGENVKAQLDVCRDYAQTKGYTVIAELAEDDRGASGAEIDLPQLNRVRDMAQAGEFDVLVVREVDRLARTLAKSQIVEDELKSSGVRVEFALYDFPDTPEGRLNKNIYASFAEFEREKISQRMIRGRRRSAKSGNVLVFGRSPFGYKEVETNGRRSLAIDDVEAATVHLIFTWYTSGDGEKGPLSIRQITKKLSELEIPTYTDLRNESIYDSIRKTKRGRGKWGMGTVSSILSNETYAGTWHFGKRGKRQGPVIAIEVPAIITREVWEAAQERKSHNIAFSRKNVKYEYLLRRRLRCGDCNGRVTTQSGYYKDKVYLYYRCDARYRGLSCSMRLNFRTDVVDALAWEWLKSLLTDEAGLKESLRKYQAEREELNHPLRDKLKTVDGLIAEHEKQLERLLDLYLGGDFAKEMLVERKQRLEKTLDGLREEQTRLAALLKEQEFSESRIMSILEFAQAVRDGIEEADEDFEARRRFVELMDVTGEIAIEDGEKVLYLHCVVGDTHLSVENTAICGHSQPG